MFETVKLMSGGDRSPDAGCPWGWGAVMGRGLERGSWAVGCFLILDLGDRYTGALLLDDSLGHTLTFFIKR